MKIHPFVTNFRAKFQSKTMPVNIMNDADGLPRIILSEPTGSTAEVGFPIFSLLY